MRTLILKAGLAILLTQAGTAGLPSQTPVGDPVAVAEFETRIRGYVSLHRRLEGATPTVKVSDDYAQVLAAIEALATKIRAARRDARRGDVFTPAVECWFREMLDRSLKGCDIAALHAAINEENPPNMVFALTINGPWPKGASLGPVPPRLLADLPHLPDDLQYRFLDRDLVLWDSHANLVVDYIRRALP
jgi:hypothetical protein